MLHRLSLIEEDNVEEEPEIEDFESDSDHDTQFSMVKK